MDVKHSILIIAVIAIVTMAMRYMPFLVFGGKRKTPKIINYLGKVLPFAMIGMLVVYCFKDVNPLAFPYALPEMIAALIVVATYLWKRNTLISVASGTVSYMLFVQLVFV